MLSSPEPRITEPLTNGNESTVAPATVLPVLQGTVFITPTTSAKVPIVIPASVKRLRTATDPLPSISLRRRAFMLPGVLIGSMLMLVIASLFVIPLDNGQHTRTVAETIGNLISSEQFPSVSTLQHVAPITPALPTPPPSFMKGEGYCGGTDIWGTCATAVPTSGIMGTGQMQRPLEGAVITQVFGHLEYQYWCGCWKPHTGIDLAAPYGSSVMAADSGQVIWTGWDWSGLGWAVKINHGNYIATIYGHLERFIVKAGENVTKGQVIGYEGSTGASTGPHVHFMVLVNNVWVDPTLYVSLP